MNKEIEEYIRQNLRITVFGSNESVHVKLWCAGKLISEDSCDIIDEHSHR